MKKNISILIGICFCFLQSFAQNEIDKEAKRLENLCRKNSRTPDSLSFYGKQLLSHGKKHSHLKAIIEGYFALGYSNSLQSKENIAITYLDSAIAYKKEASEKYFPDMMRIMRNKAIIYSRKGEFNTAERIYREIITACKANQKMGAVALNYNDLGIAFKQQGKLDSAVVYYKKAMHIWDSIGKEAPKTTLYLNIGNAQLEQKNDKQSTLSFKRGLKIAEQYKNERDIYRFYNNLSISYRNLKQYDSAYYFLRKLIPYYHTKKLVYLENLAYMNIGNTLFQERKLDSAEWYLQKSLRGLKPTQQVNSIGENYRLLSYVFFHDHKINLAKTYLDSSNAINVKHHLKSHLVKDYNLYARIYEKLNDFKKATEYYKLEKQISDSIYAAKTAKDYNELLVEQNVKQQQHKIKDLSNTNSIYKSNLFIAFLFILVLLVFSIILYKNYRKGKKEITQLQEELDVFKSTTAPIEANFIHLKSKAVLNTIDILYIKSDGHYLEIFTQDKNKPEIERSTLTEFLNTLPEGDFIRTHKSYIVNIHKIKIINSTQLMLQNGEWIKLSRTYKQDLKDILNKE
ncbi:LytTR family transcriptional regulator [Tenacibaculum agarivorans]|uniref:LytTR family transcriptional regulator n=1 Tax=Tenacibaculum agarivorans TaxID=1908389 RepID=UPI00094BA58E|nr:LytTR family transcriptional regulator [Tenacibaculum agarivorans]